MKILHIYDHTEPLHSGYVFRSRTLRMALERAGHECHVLSMPRHYADNKTVFTGDTEMINEKSYFRTKPTTTKLPILRELTDIKNTALYIKKLIAENNYDYLHVHSPVLGVFSALLARFLSGQKNLKIVYEIRAFWEDAAVDHGTLTQKDLKYKVIHSLETLACKMVDHIYPICNPLKHDLVDRGIDKNKMTIIPNIVTENAFADETTPTQIASLKQQYGFSDSDYVLGFIGSFYAYEGLEDLMPLMLYYKEQNVPIKLLLVGGGNTQPILSEYVTKHALENQVIFTGRIPHEQVDSHYKLCTAMIYPRRSMRLTQTVTPLKPLEAAAAKIPVILSNIGGHRELLTDKKTGFFIDNFTDIPTVAQTIKNILMDKTKLATITEHAYTYVKAHRQPDEVIKRYYKLKPNTKN
jgi:PEP-CTERM/exosortase A-associated glycosyltransferase